MVDCIAWHFVGQVLLPVGLPDEGTFDWVDQFLSKNKPEPQSLLVSKKSEKMPHGIPATLNTGICDLNNLPLAKWMNRR